ncbi:hypothetical protein TanjilG_12832 [Lupinus angustifolius]|uniref:Uncharacterized protein n=1 Tax=Lupinus angustifolius TaxID=3871 RepID=A0A1J7GPZ6_LUPAN|nr:hypothetical protein TanjilG_12832 [Lupinus angustifolius]
MHNLSHSTQSPVHWATPYTLRCRHTFTSNDRILAGARPKCQTYKCSRVVR